VIDPPLSGFTNSITYVFVALTYIADGLVAAAVILGLAALFSRAARDSVDRVVYAVGVYARPFAFLVAAVCMSGSLYYSLGAHFTPCEMCWYQRICMYPLVIVLGVGVWKREKSARIIGFFLVGIGVVLSSYHWALERGWVESATACSRTVPCSGPLLLTPVSRSGRTLVAVDAETAKARVLVVEDDRSVRESVVLALSLEGYEVESVNDGEQALVSVERGLPDVIVLDVMMPVLDGLTVCRRLRARKLTVPVLMLTARHEISDRVSGLDAGADDYLVKPFSLDELLARLRALLRRTSASGNEDVLTVGDLVLDPARRTAVRGGQPLELTKTEFDLLELLMLNAGIVLERDAIYDRIWGFDFETSSRSLDVYIGYLRRKTEADGGPRIVHTVRGVGYSVREP
jgi:two-component system response regulator MprA